MEELSKKARSFIFFVFLLPILVTIYLFFSNQIFLPSPFSFYRHILLPIILIISLVISDRFPIVFPSSKTGTAEVSVSLALDFAVAFLFTPFNAVLIAFIASALGDSLSKKQWFKTLFNASMISFTVGLTSLIFQKFFKTGLPFASAYNMITILIGMFFYFMINSSIIYFLLSTIQNKSFFIFWEENIEQMLTEIMSLFPLGVIVIYFFTYNPLLNLFILPTFVAVRTALKRRVQIMEETKNALFAIADVVDARIPDTMNHTRRVAKISEDICNSLNLPTNIANEIVLAASLHDIGKITIPDSILNKIGDLSKEEVNIIKSHSEEGEKIASKLSLFRNGAKIIRHHHERYDGTGYPDGIKGDGIPIGSRIICIADSFDTMITPRTYKSRTKTINEALEEIRINKGTQFDPHISDTFIEMIKKDYEKYDELMKNIYAVLESK